MTIVEILEQLSRARSDAKALMAPRDGPEPTQQMVMACEAATDILAALQNEGIDDADGVQDLIYDYNKLADQYKALHARFEVASNPLRRDGVWHCPACNHRIAPRHSFCHWCGKKIGGW